MEHPEPLPPGAPRDGGRLSRRDVLGHLGWAGLSALALASGPALLRFLRPAAARGGTGLVDVGAVRDVPAGAVVTRWAARHGLWLVHHEGRVFALEARCTHLGCTPRWEPDRGVFHCPCHGSRFTTEGEVLNGPAVQPLPRLAIAREGDALLVDRARRAPMERARHDPRFWVPG